MQKKLMVVAVAGAFGAPALAFAQASTVQIYGTVYMEYSYAKQGASPAGIGRPRVDFLQTPGSAIGFRGEEKLGGGLSAWFQCESTADYRGMSGEGFCRRNSAIGLRGGHGNLFIGNWDTPFKRAIAPPTVGSNDTGIWGSSFLLKGGSTTTQPGVPIPLRGLFSRRQTSSVNYDTPNFGGFQASAAYSTTQGSVGVLDTTPANKPRIWSLSAQYSAGPLFVSAGYERHNDAASIAGVGLDDKAWFVGAAYTFGPVRFGGVYTRQKFDWGPAFSDSEARAYHLGLDWRLAGPHGVRAAYTRAQDMKGTPGAPTIGGSSSTRPSPGGNTGAELWQIRYVYTFSKRTEFNAGYVKLDNEGGAFYNLGGLTAPAPGTNQSAWAISMRHRF
jgi:predicted porin